MKDEKTIRELKKKIERVGDDEVLEDYFELTNKGGHWLDCLEWVLENKNEKS